MFFLSVWKLKLLCDVYLSLLDGLQMMLNLQPRIKSTNHHPYPTGSKSSNQKVSSTLYEALNLGVKPQPV